MAPPMQLASLTGVPFTPTSDALDRHEYGVTKNRKVTSTGGGRAWSEDEEVYLLQTRLQKMPYKHIAAHLKKTELACRLHYHQLSHGSNRRKRTTSCSSGSSASHSPILTTAVVASPVHETSPRTMTPPGSAGSLSHEPASPCYPASVQLPSIVAAGAGTGNSISPRLPAILPKPASMSLALPVASPAAASALGGCYPPTPMPDSARSLGPSPFAAALPSPVGNQMHAPSLRLDCSLPPPSAAPVDLARLHGLYAAHRSAFWSAIAAEYSGSATPGSGGVSPIVLEQAWKASLLAAGGSGGYGGSPTPLTPVTSPRNDREGPGGDGRPGLLLCGDGYRQAGAADRTRISAILGIDANPRSPREREMVRRLEEERSGSVAATA
ncbi:hypothetical protein GGR56DRAFT_312114 [Xylariaceae sp. FL0804]|nr:hypothetical protein GGR56DRAFT_312114 [Xylariaceae sp. FL0804]